MSTEQPSDQDIIKAVQSFAKVRGTGLLPNLLAFGRVMKDLGFRVGLSQMMDATRSLEFVDIGRREDFYTVLRSNLISEREQMPLFDRVFECFWKGMTSSEESGESEELVMPSSVSREGWDEPGEVQEETTEVANGEEDQTEEGDPFSLPTYSPQEILNQKDFSEMGIEESRAISRAILLIASKIATQVSRRKKRAVKGDEIDPRWTTRKSLKYGGEVIEFVMRKRRIKKTRIVLLCDVSGSMDCYSRFLIQFMYGLQNELWGVEKCTHAQGLPRCR